VQIADNKFHYRVRRDRLSNGLREAGAMLSGLQEVRSASLLTDTPQTHYTVSEATDQMSVKTGSIPRKTGFV